MENNNNVIRTAKNEVSVKGIVKEAKNLKVFEKDGKKSMSGSLVVKTGEFSEAEVRVFVGELTKKGDVKKAYSTLEKIMNNELRTLANADEENEAIKVEIFGNGDFTPHLTENSYVGNDGNFKHSVQLDLSFGNIVLKDDLKEEDYCATFDVEAYIKNIKEEVKNGEETGRVIVDCLVPVYGNSVLPISLVAGKVIDEESGEEFDMADALRDGANNGDTLEFWGDIINIARIEKIRKESKFGVGRTVEKREFVKEFAIIGADVVSEDNEYSDEEIKEALANREIKLETIREKAEAKESSSKRRVGFGNKTEGNEKPQRAQRPRF